MRWLALVVLVAGCRREPVPQSPIGSASTRPDPWAVAPRAEDPPDLATVHALAEKACPKVARPYLFEIEKAGKVSHILGTRHLGVPLAKLPARVPELVRAAKLAVFETPPDDDDSDEAPVAASLADQLGPELWTKYRALVGPINAERVEHAVPSTAVITLIALYEDKLAALDLELEHVVREANVPSKGLETSAFQQHLLDELMDLRMLKAAVAGTPDRKALEKEATGDLAEYCAGTDDTPGMDETAKSELRAAGYTPREIEAFDDKLVFARNRDWIPKLEAMFAQGDVFVAVGADHLIGSRGVIALLAARGWTTTRLTTP